MVQGRRLLTCRVLYAQPPLLLLIFAAIVVAATAACCVCPTAPNLLGGLNTKGVDKHRVGVYGILGPGGFTTVIFANSIKTAIKNSANLPTNMLIGVSVLLEHQQEKGRCPCATNYMEGKYSSK